MKKYYLPCIIKAEKLAQLLLRLEAGEMLVQVGAELDLAMSPERV